MNYLDFIHKVWIKVARGLLKLAINIKSKKTTPKLLLGYFEFNKRKNNEKMSLFGHELQKSSVKIVINLVLNCKNFKKIKPLCCKNILTVNVFGIYNSFYK